MNKTTFILCLALAVILFQAVSFAAVKTGEFVILDENVDAVVKYITKGSGTPKKVADAYAGKEALYVGGTGGDGQRYNDKAPWTFKIAENPKADDEFRYITFAWKKNGGTGIQLQLHGNPDTWGHRYHAGANVKNWNPSIQVSKSVPTKWEKHTRDLFKDWKAFTLTGIAFSAWPDGDDIGGFWDYVVLHQNPEVTEVKTSVESKGKLTTKWAKLKK